jgi:hypothetical protein
MNKNKSKYIPPNKYSQALLSKVKGLYKGKKTATLKGKIIKLK